MDSNKNDATKIREEKRQARTLENMEIKLSEQMEMMKQLITTSAVISIDELCFYFRTAVQTESVNVPLHLSFERHFKLLIDYAGDDRNAFTVFTNATEQLLPSIISTGQCPVPSRIPSLKVLNYFQPL